MESATCKSSELEAFKIVEIAGYLYSHFSCVLVKMTSELCLGYCFRILMKVLLLPTQVKHLFVQGFVQVMENLESLGILLWHFPGLESPGKRPLVLESSGNLFNSA